VPDNFSEALFRAQKFTKVRMT